MAKIVFSTETTKSFYYYLVDFFVCAKKCLNEYPRRCFCGGDSCL